MVANITLQIEHAVVASTTLQIEHDEVASVVPTVPNVKIFPVRHTVDCQDRLLYGARRRCGLANQHALTNTRGTLRGQMEEEANQQQNRTCPRQIDQHDHWRVNRECISHSITNEIAASTQHHPLLRSIRKHGTHTRLPTTEKATGDPEFC